MGGGGAALPFHTGSKPHIDFFKRSEESREGILKTLRPLAQLPEIARAELVCIGNHSRAQGTILVRALCPGRPVFAIDPKGESHVPKVQHAIFDTLTEALMYHGLSTYLFVDHRLTTALLDKISRAGVQGVELFCGRQHFDYRNKAQIAELGYWFKDSELKLHSIHSPMYSDDCWGQTGPDACIDLTEPVKGKRIKIVDEVKWALEVAETVPFEYMVQHLGVNGAEDDPRRVDAAFASLEELKVFGAPLGVEILLENTPNALSTGAKLVEFLKFTHLEMNLCFDTGHAHMTEGIEAAYEAMAPLIRSTHVHDNNGKDDIHLFPKFNREGTIPWKSTMELLSSAGSQYPLLLEVRDDPTLPALDSVQHVFEFLEGQI